LPFYGIHAVVQSVALQSFFAVKATTSWFLYLLLGGGKYMGMIKSKFLSFILLFPVIFVALLSGGCAGERDGEVKSRGNAVYTIADPTGDWGYPSPYGHYARGPGYVRMSFIFDTLVWKNQNEFVPALARDWSYDAGDNAYSFTLREDVKWHDGEQFDASDVVFTLNYIKNHPYNWVDGTLIKKVTMDGPFNVSIYLKEPYAPFLSNVAGTMPILPEHIYKNVENPSEFRGENALVGTGPFKLLDYSKEHGTYLYEANADYYGGKPAVDRLKFLKLSREMAAAALNQGEVNAAEVPPETVESLEAQGISILESPFQWNAKLIFNYKKAPFSQKKIRQAFAYAINRKAMVDIVLRGHGEAASPGILPPDSPWYNPDVNKYQFNVQKAMSLIEEAGYQKSQGRYVKDGEALNVEMLIAPRFSREAELLKEQLKQAGIQVNVRSLEAKTVDARVADWEFEVALSGHGGLGGDPEILNKVILGEGFNSARYTVNEELTQLLAQQLFQTEQNERERMVHQIQEIYAEDLPSLSLYYPLSYWGHTGLPDLYYTNGGLASGIPIPLNKLCFIQ
jgi:peptide/nickel transport system substrate-binding protein